jgi:hypothetical protein
MYLLSYFRAGFSDQAEKNSVGMVTLGGRNDSLFVSLKP